jgi:chromosome segregation ATPase
MTGDAELEAAPLHMGVDELRLEKISQRVTLISILIPVLIVIVLVIAYLDIKKRMTYSEDTDTMEFQKLSSDLESRFSSLSVRQARLEDALSRLSEQHNDAIAAININLDKMKKTVEQVTKAGATQKELDTAKKSILQQIEEISAAVKETDSRLEVSSQEIESRIGQMIEAQTTGNARLDKIESNFSGVEESLTALEQTKIDKQKLDLALKLEELKIEQSVKSRLEAFQSNLKMLEQKISELSAPKAQVPQTPKPPPVSPQSGSQNEKPNTSNVVIQNLNK